MDKFLLLQLLISQEDFYQLKQEQNLLIDFVDFSQKLIELLNLFQCKLIDNKFHIIETNSFKHITHLTLKFISADDETIKTHLTGQLKELQVDLY